MIVCAYCFAILATKYNIVKRIIMPILAIIGSIFMIIAAIYSHKIGVVYFVFVMIIIMIIGAKVKDSKNNDN